MESPKRTLKVTNQTIVQYVIFCPACGCGHGPTVPPWKFNGNLEYPTFSPSIHVKLDKNKVCHSHVKDGKISYCNDSTHEFRGQTLELPIF